MQEDMRNTCPVRLPGFTMTWSGSHLLILSKEKNSRHELNPTAATIWLMCDGKLNVKGIEHVLRRRYPCESTTVQNDLAKTIETLKALHLIELIDSDLAFIHAFEHSFLRPVIRVGFAGFWDSFDPFDNFFLHMLAPHFDVMIVDPEQHAADLIFYTDSAETTFNHEQIDRRKCLKVLVHNGKTPPDFSSCDYVFTDQYLDDRFKDRCSNLPFWIYYIDWSAYKKTEPTPDSENRLDPLYPNAIFRHFYQALFADIVPDNEEYDHSRIQLPLFNPDPPSAIHNTSVAALERPKLTIGMAVYDEYDAVYFTLQAIRLYHSEVLENAEIIVVDNNPNGKYATHLQKLMKSIQGGIGECRYIPHPYTKGTAVKDIVFRYAKGEYVLCIDSHVMVEKGAIQKLIDYLDAHPDCKDLLQGPLMDDRLATVSTHFNPVWSGGMYGQWGTDERGDDPTKESFEIPMQGTGLLACRKTAWLGYNPRFKGFGGEEGYIHEKYRKAERGTLCLPFLRWVHRFDRPDGTPYPNIHEDRIRNYYLGFLEVGLDTAPIQDYFCKKGEEDHFHRIKRDVWAELINPFTYFDAIYCMTEESQPSRWGDIQTSFKRLGILHRIRRFSAIESPEPHHIRTALAHRDVIKHAQIQGLRNVLIIEDDALFLEDILNHLERTINELKTKPWKVFHMGRHRIENRFPRAPGCNFLLSPGQEPTCMQSVAYSYRAYQAILDDVPDNPEDMQGWIMEHPSLDQYITRLDERYLAFPIVTSGVTGL